MLGRLKRATMRTLDRLFLRPTIREVRQTVGTLAQRLDRVEAAGRLDAELFSTKLDYLVARLDALADIDDQIGAEQRLRLEQTTRAFQQLIEGHEDTRMQERALREDVGQLVTAHASTRAELEALRQEFRLSATAAAETGRRLGEVHDKVTLFAADQLALNRKAEAFQAAASTQIDRIGRSYDSSWKDISAAVSALDARVERSADRIVRDLTRTAFNEFRQQEALDALRDLMRGAASLSGTRGWAGSPDFLLHLFRHIAAHRPTTIIELGSGASTLVAAAALRANGGGTIHSLDHDPAYAAATRDLLARHGLEQHVTVHDAPLEPWKPSAPSGLGEEWQWYRLPAEVENLAGIDLLVIDGPPAASGPYARYPAVPAFLPRMSAGSVVFLDDALRDDEQAIARAWSTEFGLPLELRLKHDRDFEKGLAILRKSP